MQEAMVGGWGQGWHLSAQTLGSLRDLNHRFLDLLAARAEWIAGRVAPLSAAQRAAAAGCPYALFDLRFQDEAHWRLRLQNAGTWRVADESATDHAPADHAAADAAAVSFARIALFYAWHVASSAGLGARLLLGMSGSTAAAFGHITVNQLPALAATEAVHLSARWSGCNSYWSALTAAAACADQAALRRVQLYGLQLAAAAWLPDP